MKVKVIGSGSMWTSYQSASYKIDEDILVDIPNGMCKNLFRWNFHPKQIHHVLITHFHGDHYFDIPFYLLIKAKNEDKEVHIYCSEEGEEKNRKLVTLAFPNTDTEIMESLSLKYHHTQKFRIHEYEVEKILVDHGTLKSAYGYLFQVGKKKVGFTGDTCLCPAVERMAQECSYLFCDCMLKQGNTKHMGIDNIIQLTEQNPNCQLIVSHLEDTTREELKKRNIKNVRIPEDGEEIIIAE